MPSMKEITCKCGCGKKKMIRVADIKRGWGKFFSKSCKAIYQEKRTQQHGKYLKRQTMSSDDIYYADTHQFSSEAHEQE